VSGRKDSAIEVRGVARRFGDQQALSDIDLTVGEGEFFSLLGPSGCGKTTLLRILAGLDLPDSGSVRIGGEDVAHVPAHRRQVNTVFQSYALFPHLSVKDNVAFGLRMKKVAPNATAGRVARAMELVRIAPLADRKPAELSGGQKQRVALARALVNEPRVLLLDEPLAALDLKLRKELQTELRDLQRRLGMTFLCVTHDQEEALVLSDTIAVMRAGRVEQVGSPQELYERPRTRFVSGFLGSCNLLAATVRERRASSVLVDTPAGLLRLEPAPAGDAALRSAFTLAVRPEKVVLLPAAASAGENRLPARITSALYVGAESRYVLEAGGQLLSAVAMNIGAAGAATAGLAEGAGAIAYLPPAALVVLDD